MAPTTSSTPTLPTMLLLPTTLLDMLESTTLARGPLTLMLMPTPSDRLPLVFPLPTLLPPDMLTTPDTLPTLPTPPTTCTTPTLPTMSPLSPMAMALITVLLTLVKSSFIQIVVKTFQFKVVFQK